MNIDLNALIQKVISRKAYVAIVAMVLIAQSQADDGIKAIAIGVIALLGMFMQWGIDFAEVQKTGRDQPDNGNGGSEAK